MLLFVQEPDQNNPGATRNRPNPPTPIIDLKLVNKCVKDYEQGFSTFMGVEAYANQKVRNDAWLAQEKRDREKMIASRYRRTMGRETDYMGEMEVAKTRIKKVVQFGYREKNLVDRGEYQIRMSKFLWRKKGDQSLYQPIYLQHEEEKPEEAKTVKKNVSNKIANVLRTNTQKPQQKAKAKEQSSIEAKETIKQVIQKTETPAENIPFNPFLAKTTKMLDLNSIILGKFDTEAPPPMVPAQPIENQRNQAPQPLNFHGIFNNAPVPTQINNHQPSFNQIPAPVQQFNNFNQQPMGIFGQPSNQEQEQYRKNAIAMFYKGSNEQSEQLFGETDRTSKKPRIRGKRGATKARIS